MQAGRLVGIQAGKQAGMGCRLEVQADFAVVRSAIGLMLDASVGLQPLQRCAVPVLKPCSGIIIEFTKAPEHFSCRRFPFHPSHRICAREPGKDKMVQAEARPQKKHSRFRDLSSLGVSEGNNNSVSCTSCAMDPLVYHKQVSQDMCDSSYAVARLS